MRRPMMNKWSLGRWVRLVTRFNSPYFLSPPQSWQKEIMAFIYDRVADPGPSKETKNELWQTIIFINGL